MVKTGNIELQRFSQGELLQEEHGCLAHFIYNNGGRGASAS